MSLSHEVAGKLVIDTHHTLSSGSNPWIYMDSSRQQSCEVDGTASFTDGETKVRGVVLSLAI